MSAPLAKQPYALLTPSNLTYGATPVQRGRGVSLSQRLGAAVRWVFEFPQRAAVIDELSRLTDRELNDIGLVRGEIRTVFSRSF